MFDKPVVTKLLCVALVAAIVLPVGRMLFPYVSQELTGMQFQAIEAVVSATRRIRDLFDFRITRAKRLAISGGARASRAISLEAADDMFMDGARGACGVGSCRNPSCLAQSRSPPGCESYIVNLKDGGCVKACSGAIWPCRRGVAPAGVDSRFLAIIICLSIPR